MTAEDRYKEWLSDPYFDSATKEELKEIAQDQKEIQERFYKELEFGTAGLRGIIGAGTNRMNKYTVQKATQGLANYIKKAGLAHKGAVIAYDSRRMSPEFAREAALCFAGNGIKAYLFDSLRPTPELSFAVRYLHGAAGINITASHNPADYNGYKVYWEDGAQITPPHDSGITEEVRNIKDFSQVHSMSEEEAGTSPLIEYIGAEIDDAYIGVLKEQVLNWDAIDRMKDELEIVYTPLHGAGNLPVRRVLRELGYTKVSVVKEQEEPDGEFPTVSYPNPETAEAFELGIKLAKKCKADLILATDPDADRLGIYVRDIKTNEYHPLTGNMAGCLIGDYILAQKSKKAPLPLNGVWVKSIVTTPMADAIADYYGIEHVQVLTGFKYIGEKIREYEKDKSHTYLFGMEESYGCLPATYARDKDAVVAAMLLCEAAAYYKTMGKTLWDAMSSMYERYGFYLDEVKSITLEGMDGRQKMQEIMENLRSNPPTHLGGRKVMILKDYEENLIINKKMGITTETALPKSNVLYYEMEQNEWVAIRPSGTEPKIKIYYGVKGTSLSDADSRLKKLEKSAVELLSM
ncbi:MAG: phospho-sugar mutase [Lachnospiraceae bacterium]